MARQISVLIPIDLSDEAQDVHDLLTEHPHAHNLGRQQRVSVFVCVCVCVCACVRAYLLE